MFAGIAAVDVEEDNTLITAMSSREGERVRLMKPVNVKVCTCGINFIILRL